MSLNETSRLDGASLSVQFQGLPAPVFLDGCAELLPLIYRAMPQWPCTVDREGTTEPCIRVRCVAGAALAPRYHVDARAGSQTEQNWNPVSAVCQIIADLAWEIVRADESLFCLHCAAVEFGGRLVLFPDDHQAGKSTLTAVLGQRGHVVFSDDVLPVAIGPDGQIEGLANGILPRVRLPLPAELSPGFRAWAEGNPGPANRQYKYLDIPRLAPQGRRLPIGAIVRLDRRDGAATMLQPLARGEAFESVVGRNFARETHAGRILTAFEALARQARLHRLSYASAEDAADLLAGTFGEWSGSPPAQAQTDTPRAPSGPESEAPGFNPAAVYARAEGLTETVLDGLHYLADGDGQGIFRLNPGARAIWAVLGEPATGAEIGAILSDAFPDAEPANVAADCARAIGDLLRGRLVVPLPAR